MQTLAPMSLTSSLVQPSASSVACFRSNLLFVRGLVQPPVSHADTGTGPSTSAPRPAQPAAAAKPAAARTAPLERDIDDLFALDEEKAEGWDFEEDIANEDFDVEVNKELGEEQRQLEEEALDEERRALDRELKKVCSPLPGEELRCGCRRRRCSTRSAGRSTAS